MRQSTAILLWAAVNAVVLGEAYIEGHLPGLIVALVFTAGVNALLYQFADKIMLRRYEARQPTSEEFGDLLQTVESMVYRLDLPMPRLFVIPPPSRRAFVTGVAPDRAFLALSVSLINELNSTELAIVILHELGHLRKYNRTPAAIVARIARAFVDLASMALWSSSGEPAEVVSRRERRRHELEVECLSVGCDARI